VNTGPAHHRPRQFAGPGSRPVADVTCGNIHTANATVYVINKVLTPMHWPCAPGTPTRSTWRGCPRPPAWSPGEAAGRDRSRKAAPAIGRPAPCAAG